MRFSICLSPTHGYNTAMLKAGIIGLPNVGKSTLFNAVNRSHKAPAENYPFCTIEPNLGVVSVPDPRLPQLGRVVKVNTLIPTAFEFVDIAGLVKGASHGEGLGNKFLSHIREVDALIHVVRCFEDPDIVHVTGDIDPVRDIEIVTTELVVADLETIKKRLEKISRDVKRGDKHAVLEAQLLEKLGAHLNTGKPANTLGLPLAPGGKADRPQLLPPHRQADHFRRQREGGRSGHRGQSPAGGQSPRIRPRASCLRDRGHLRPTGERPGRPLAGGGAGVSEGAWREGIRHRRVDPQRLPSARAADLLHLQRQGSPRLDGPCRRRPR